MVEKELRFTKNIKCCHCGNEAPMIIQSSFSQIITQGADTWWSRDAGPVYEILTCQSCDEVTFRRYIWIDGEIDDRENETYYPKNNTKFPENLPLNIQKELTSAIDVRNSNANAYAVLLGRVLELVCRDRGALKGDLVPRLNELSSKGEIPDQIVRVAKNLHELRHAGAHAWVGELTSDEVPVLDSLVNAVLESVYGVPQLIEQAEERLKKLRKMQRSKKKNHKKTP